MIKNLEIENFKSIKHLKLDCKKINLFIGEPNTGKSNLLESLGLLSHAYYRNIHNFIRLENMTNLFYDENLDDIIKISYDKNFLEIRFKDGKFIGDSIEEGGNRDIFNYDYGGSGTLHELSTFSKKCHKFKFYRFEIRNDFPEQISEFILPPSGNNLSLVLLTHKELRTLTKQIFDKFGFRVVIKPRENKIEIQKDFEDIIISYPYSLSSDTLQRIVFYLTAIKSNKDSILTFEEPETHAFPYYTKYLAEIIALNKNNNQYFITTHNPYLLLSILEKAPKDDVGVFITYFEDYQTKVKQLSEKELQEIMDLEIDVFFNFERFLDVH